MTTIMRPLSEASPPKPRGSRPRRRGQRQGVLIAMAMPAIIAFLVFNIGPLMAVFLISLTSYQGILSTPEFIGLDNFRTMFTDPVFWTSARITAIHVTVLLPVLMPLSFMLGYYLSTKPPLAGLLRVNLFAPALISVAAKAMVFFAILAPTGILNGVLENLGLDGLTKAWLANPDTALASIIAINLWNGIGYTAVLFNARLSGIPQEVLEAAEIDGAGHWQKMWRISFPMARGYFGILTMLQFLWILFTSAADILLLTRGGPGRETTTWSYLLYDKAFAQQQIGYSQALGVLLFIVGVMGIVVIRKIFKPSY